MLNRIFKKKNGILLIWLLGLMTMLCPDALADEWGQQFQQKLQQWLKPQRISAVLGRSGHNNGLHADLIRFYQYRQCRPAWLGIQGLLPQGEAALAIIRRAAGQGLNTGDYYNCMLDELLIGMAGLTQADRTTRIGSYIKLDLMLTDTILRYAMHVSSGRMDFATIKYANHPDPSSHRDLAAELAAMLDSDKVTSFLGQLGPRHSAYRALQKGLLEYRKIKETGGWPVIADGPTLKFGDRGTRVAMLRYRLAVSKDADFVPGVVDDQFDDALAVAVMRFQRRHGLEMDGMVGPGTLQAINVPVEQRIRQIELNLERWRWMPSKFEPYHILVNIPSFELTVVDNGQTVKTLRAIVGREERPTPVLSSTMTYLELNPYWNVPSKIARKDLLPKIRKDPKFLTRQNFQVFVGWNDNDTAIDPAAINWAGLSENNFPYRLRQAPTPYNALGRVKFMFPNEYSVYIHDTPSKRLFGRSARSFSSGCVRVEKPLELASFLLQRQNWNRERLDETLASGERRVVVLKEPVPVYLVYLTAWAEENGQVHFLEDIYGHDLQLQALLNKNSESAQRCPGASDPTYFVETAQGDQPSAGI